MEVIQTQDPNSRQNPQQAQPQPSPQETMLAALVGQVQNLSGLVQSQQEQLNQLSQREFEPQEEAPPDDLATLLNSLDAQAQPKKSLEDMSNREMVNVLSSSLSQVLQARESQQQKAFQQGLKEISEAVTGNQKALAGVIAALGVDRTKNQYQDFGQYEPIVAKILQAKPDLSPEYAYFIAKGLAAKQGVPASQTASERPAQQPQPYRGGEGWESAANRTRFASGEAPRQNPEEPLISSRAGLELDLAQVVDRVVDQTAQGLVAF